MNHELWRRLHDLLNGRGEDAGENLPGAELIVSEDGQEVFRAALARHARRDEDDPAVIWIRPLVGGSVRANLPVFDLAAARRRALHVAEARTEGESLVLDLVTGQEARVRPARGAQLAALQDFDTWLITLTAEERAEAEALDHD
ncbi:hypothetical protein Amsp01_050010 [Amycolatopsis sp. NBRC 101858]|uniref:hypothetical protein n=1 Tax=Amycolatopsis sp. NBRC 101858 TaxID=3032200 RepID=UPI0024A31D83|nr:hypothetical protein [Amycolatopsis sp. NBRC 101858]GLY38977.1 hypothetical protein Amsp01_050010 [Amycolatopsis sp. NBRC 101858]